MGGAAVKLPVAELVAGITEIEAAKDVGATHGGGGVKEYDVPLVIAAVFVVLNVAIEDVLDEVVTEWKSLAEDEMPMDAPELVVFRTIPEP